MFEKRLRMTRVNLESACCCNIASQMILVVANKEMNSDPATPSKFIAIVSAFVNTRTLDKQVASKIAQLLSEMTFVSPGPIKRCPNVLIILLKNGYTDKSQQTTNKMNGLFLRKPLLDTLVELKLIL